MTKPEPSANPATEVRRRIADAARAAGRDPAEITLVAITKGFDWRAIEPLIEAAALTDLGENRVQDLVAKQAAAGEGVRWHMIGTLQRNKVADVAGRVALIHSVDSARLAESIGAHAHGAGRRQDVLLQVNTSGEATKHGVDVADAERVALKVARTEGVRLTGFMTIASPQPGRARECFAALRRVRDAVVATEPEARHLSMGMSGDLEDAIAEGATIVRVGTAIFGERPQAGAAAPRERAKEGAEGASEEPTGTKGTDNQRPGTPPHGTSRARAIP